MPALDDLTDRSGIIWKWRLFLFSTVSLRDQWFLLCVEESASHSIR